ncbi:MAG: hypothetical protein AABN33_21680 [Acidobacteriota bacterium]
MSREKQAIKTATPARKDIDTSVTEAGRRSPVSPSSTLLDMHLTELEEECARFVALLLALRSMAAVPEWADEDVRESTEGNLYASLSHLKNHVQPALDEMDRLLDEMPDDDEDDSKAD